MIEEGRVLEKLDRMHVDIGKIEQHLSTLNGTIARHEARLCVVEDWRSLVDRWRDDRERDDKETTKAVVDLKVEIAKMAALGGSFGAVISVVVAILKAGGIL